MRLRTRVFDWGAGVYDWMTRQEVWREHCRSFTDLFPRPSQNEDGRPLRVLDLGIGPGVSGLAVLDRLPDARVVGLDLSPRMLRRARRHARAERRSLALVRADGVALPFPRETFDVVMAHSFLYIVPDRDAAVAEIVRVLKPGGRCVLLEPNARPPRTVWLRLGGPPRFYFSMITWRLYSRTIGRFTPDSLAAQLDPHLTQVQIHPTLGGLGLRAIADAPRPPDPQTSS